ncbi:probable peroxidase 26 [Helianthus annuus]|nr:probable peroxidase 26 [Helianthus annuus]
MTISRNITESDHEMSVDNRSGLDSKELLTVPDSNAGELAVVPMRKPKGAEVAQRRIRRPFSVSEVEALVKGVEKLGTGSLVDSRTWFLRKKRRTSIERSMDRIRLPSFSWESSLAYFESKGLDVQDMVTLLGAHMMRRVRCINIHDCLYNFNNTRKPDPTMEESTLSYLRNGCPPKTRLGQPNPLINLNPSNLDQLFTNSYYSQVLTNKVVLGVDQQLRYGGDTYVKR